MNTSLFFSFCFCWWNQKSKVHRVGKRSSDTLNSLQFFLPIQHWSLFSCSGKVYYFLEGMIGLKTLTQDAFAMRYHQISQVMDNLRTKLPLSLIFMANLEAFFSNMFSWLESYLRHNSSASNFVKRIPQHCSS